MTTEIAEIEITDEAISEFLNSDDGKEHGRCPICLPVYVGDKTKAYCGHPMKANPEGKFCKIGSSGKPVCQPCLAKHREHAKVHFPNRRP